MNKYLLEFQALFRYRYVVFAYVETNLRLRYRRSYLGFFWTLLAPILHYLVMGFVFTLIIKSNMPNYFAYYFVGALVFGLITGVLNKAPHFFIANEHFIKKVAVPKMIYILNGIGYEIINFLLSGLGLLVLAIAFQKIHFSVAIFWSFISIILLSFFLLGLASVIAVSTVYFRDFFYIIPVLLQIAFFVTPVIYSEDMIPERYHIFLILNPFYYFLQVFREPILHQSAPNPQDILICAGLALVSFVIGFVVVKKFENRIIFKL